MMPQAGAAVVDLRNRLLRNLRCSRMKLAHGDGMDAEGAVTSVEDGFTGLGDGEADEGFGGTGVEDYMFP